VESDNEDDDVLKPQRLSASSAASPWLLTPELPCTAGLYKWQPKSSNTMTATIQKAHIKN
jgi:hypothetical protein